MKISDRIKPMSFLKAHAPEVLRDLAESRTPVVITLHGEARAVMQDVESFEETQETLALLKVLALENRNIAEGKVTPASEAFDRVRKQRRN